MDKFFRKQKPFFCALDIASNGWDGKHRRCWKFISHSRNLITTKKKKEQEKCEKGDNDQKDFNVDSF